MKKRVIFMGTPIFAVSILETLSHLNCEIIAVFSQPDRKVGRKQEITLTPVKTFALTKNYPCYQPESIKDAYDLIQTLEADLLVTCAYGQFIPSRILALPKYGAINVHASLLPKYRGGAPIHTAIIQGEKMSGVTLMRMTTKMDAGAILFQAIVDIEENETMGSLHDKLMLCGSELLKVHFDDLFKPDLIEITQNEAEVSYAPNISADQEFVSFNRNSSTIVSHINGLSPWPIAYGIVDTKKIKLYSAYSIDYTGDEKSGQIIGIIQKALAIRTRDGAVCIPELQLEGKKRCDAVSLWAGNAQQLINQIFKETQ